jgi:hypothetical protein
MSASSHRLMNAKSYKYVYADASARAAASGFAPEDVGYLALQLDTQIMYMLIDDSPVTWLAITPSALPPSGTAGGVLAGSYPNPSFAVDMATQAELDAGITTAEARANHTGSQTASTISDFDTQVRTSRLDQLAAPTGPVPLNSQKLTGVADPTTNQDAATKAYVDALVQGIRWKAPVRAASTANVSLTAPGAAIDGVTLASGDRVLLKDQTTAADNGLYVWTGASSTLTRTTDADTATEVTQAATFVMEGTANSDKLFVNSTNAPITLGTTALTFVTFSSAVGALLASNNLSDLGSVATARTNLGLGTAATQASTAFAAAAHKANHEVGGSDPFTGIVPGSAFAPGGLTGATAATRFVGGTAASAPASGTFALGDFVITQSGSMYICTVAGTPGTWTQVSGGGGGMTNPMTTAGDIIIGGTSGTPTRLAKGSDSYVLTMDPTTHLPVWAAATGGGGTGTSALPMISVSASFSAVNNVNNTPSFTTELYKDAGFTHDNATNPSRIGVTNAGRYQFEVAWKFGGTAGNFTTWVVAAYTINGGSPITIWEQSPSTFDTIVSSRVITLALNAGDYVEFPFTQNGAGTLTVTYTAKATRLDAPLGGTTVNIGALEYVGKVTALGGETSLTLPLPTGAGRALRITGRVRKNAATAATCFLVVNGDTTSGHYVYEQLQGSGTSASAGTAATLGGAVLAGVPGTGETPAQSWAYLDYQLPFYQDTSVYKRITGEYSRLDSSGTLNAFWATEWLSTAAITGLVVTLGGTDQFVAGSEIAVYVERDNVAQIAAGGALSETLLTSAAATITLPIPAGYKDLEVVIVGRGDGAATNPTLTVRANGDSGANYDYTYLFGQASPGTTAESQALGQTGMFAGYLLDTGAGATFPGSVRLMLDDYESTTFYKHIRAENAVRRGTGSTDAFKQDTEGWWKSTAPITSLTLSLSAGNFVAGSVVRVYARGGVSVQSAPLPKM